MSETAAVAPPVRKFVVASLLWLAVGVSMGGFFASNPGFLALKYSGHEAELIFASVHSHINLLGWLSNALFAATYGVLPRAFSRPLYSPRLARYHFWLLNVGLAGMMAALFAATVADALVYIPGRDQGAELFGPGDTYLPWVAFQSVLRWGVPFAAMVILGAAAFAANVWLTLGLPPRLARLANDLRDRFPLPARLLGAGSVPETVPSESRALPWLFRVAAAWLVAGLLLGGLLGSPPLFTWLKLGGYDWESMFASVHSHMTVLGWLGNGLFAVLYAAAFAGGRPLPKRRLRAHLWLYNAGLAGLLAVLAAASYVGRATYLNTGALTDAQRLYPYEVSQSILRLGIPFALLFAGGVATAIATLWRSPPGDPPSARFLRAGMAWLAAGLVAEGILSLDPIYFWLVRSGHEFEIMEVVVKDHMVMLGGISALAFGLLYALAAPAGRGPRFKPRLAAAHFWLMNVGLAGFLLFYAIGGYAGGHVFQTASNPYGPGGALDYLPYHAALAVTLFGTPFILLLAASLILFIAHAWRIWARNGPEADP